MKTKALFLDFYGTLVYEDGEIISRICERIRRMSPVSQDTKEIGSFWWKEFFSSCIDSFGANFRLQREIELASLRKTLQKFGCMDSAEDISEELFNYWSKPPIFEDTIQFLNKVNNPMCIVSNIDRVDLMSAVKHHNINVTNIVTSEDVRSYKPSPEIFLHALELMNLNPEDVLHVGDSLSSDVEGAKNLGIKTCWLNRNKKNIADKHGADIVCFNLLELINYIN